MSYFSARRFLSARKSWSVFTRKIKTNLYKLQLSKAIKKQKMKNQLKVTKKQSFWPALSSFQSYRQCGRGTGRVRKLISHSRYRPQKRIPPPVYVDQLFVNQGESSTAASNKRIPPPVYVDQLFVNQGESSTAASNNQVQKFSPRTEKNKLIDQQVSAVSITSNREDDVKERKKHTSGDDMWESLVLASPQMDGINERAEEFILRFRAEMRKQEGSASHL